MHVGSTDRNRYPCVLFLDTALTSTTGRWDFVVPPCASISATATATPDNDGNSGGGLTGMVAVGATTACATGVFCKHVVDGGSTGGGKGNDADDAMGTEDADPLIVVVTFVHLDVQSEERQVRQLGACLEDGGGEGKSSVTLIPTTKTVQGWGGWIPTTMTTTTAGGAGQRDRGWRTGLGSAPQRCGCRRGCARWIIFLDAPTYQGKILVGSQKINLGTLPS